VSRRTLLNGFEFTEHGRCIEMRRMPQKFEALAAYNAERARGIAHTAEWDAKMAALQAEYDQHYARSA
jgi:hypothetical protein